MSEEMQIKLLFGSAMACAIALVVLNVTYFCLICWPLETTALLDSLFVPTTIEHVTPEQVEELRCSS